MNTTYKMPYEYELLEDFSPFKKGDMLCLSRRTVIYNPKYHAFNHPEKYEIVFIPIEKLKKL